MFRGRPRRGGAFPWDFHPHGPPSGPVAGLRGPISGRSPQGHVHPLHRESYQEDRNRERIGYHHGYHTDSEKLRRSPPRGRLPSPGLRSTWGPGGGPSSSEPFVKRLTPSPSRGGPSTDHKLAITVGNDRTGLPAWKSGHSYDRDYHYKGQHNYPPPPEKRTSYDGRYDELAYRRRSPGRRRSRGRSRGRSRSRSPGRGRSKSRPPSRSRSRGRSRPRSHSRGRSWGRSRSRPRSRSPSRAKSHTRGRSRSCSGSSSRSSSSSSSSSSSGSRRPRASPSKDKHSEEFRELELARRRKEVEEMLAMPKKSILKKRVDSETDSPAILQGSDSPGEGGVEHQGSSLSRETERFLHTIAKGMESGLLASILQEWKEETGQGSSLKQHEENIPGVKQETWMENACDSLLPHEKVGQDVGGFSRILGLMGDSGGQQDRKKSFTDIEDEERFLYGDDEESQPPETDAPKRQYSQHGDMGMLQYSSDNPEFMQQYLSQDPAAFSPCRWDRTTVEDHLDTHSIRGNHDQNSMDVKYGRHSQPVATLKKEGKVGPELDSFPPGVGPEEAKERQDIEEYEKIQELLKTIGLDLGLAEISKMAARTQERLHGNVEMRPGRRTSSGSWDRSRHRSRSGSQSQSRSRSPSWSHRHGRSTNERSPSPPRIQSTSCDDAPVVPGSLETESRAREKSWGIPVLGMSTSQLHVPLNQPPLCPPSVPQTMGSLAVIPTPSVPAYTQNPTSNYPPPAPSYPPPGYGQYGNYLSYMPPSWPMYPPPSLEPPAAPVGGQKTSAPPGRSNLRVIETVSIETQKNKPVAQKEECSSFQGLSREAEPQIARANPQLTEEKDTNRQKQKVIEERDKLKKEREILMDKKDYLLKELERLRKQQGKLLRKKRREKDGHKDPLLAEVSRLQEEIMVQISQLRKEQEEAEKKCVELDKVALILGLHIMDKPRKENRLSRELQSSSEGDRDSARSSNNPTVGPSCDAASSKASSAPKSTPGKTKAQSPGHSPPPPASVPDQYEYYDAGDHWCKNCNTVSGSLFDFFVHLHSKSHRKTQDPYDRPWASASSKSHGRKTSAERIVKPAKGSEFLIPMAGFYCQLCKEFFGDQISAEDHVTSQTHNEKYKRHTDDFPLYEQRRNLDRQAGLAVVMDSREQRHSGVKRKLEERGDGPQSLKDEKLDACHMETDREDKAGSQRKEKEEKKQDAGEHVLVKGKKGEAIKPAEPPQRTPEIQRVISGPSPSILAKVRKRSSSSSTPLAFGKFSWKRTDKENEEEKAVECAIEQNNGGDTGGDKGEARGALNKAKTIAIKLSGKTVIPPSSPWVPTSFSPTASIKIRPNLPVPAMVLRKSLPGASSKPGSQHTVKPGSVVQDQIKEKAVVTPDLISKAFCGEEVVLKTPDTEEKATTPEEIPVASTPLNTAPSDPKEGLVEQQALSSPATCVMTLESDVAAPGVPESEQMLTIVVRPPPLLNSSDTLPKIDKPKSSLAAAKAQDLYDIFYRSSKIASDARPGPRDLKNGEALKSKMLGSLTVRAENRDSQIVPSSTSDSYQKVKEQTSESFSQGACPLQDADVGTKTVNADLNSGDN